MRPITLPAAQVRPAARRLRNPRVSLSLATIFTGGGAFLAAFGAGVHDGLDEAMGAALLGAAAIAFLIGLRQILEPEAAAAVRRNGGPSAAPRPARRA